MAFPWSIPPASPGVWEAQARRNSWAFPLALFLGIWEEGRKSSRRRELNFP